MPVGAVAGLAVLDAVVVPAVIETCMTAAAAGAIRLGAAALALNELAACKPEVHDGVMEHPAWLESLDLVAQRPR